MTTPSSVPDGAHDFDFLHGEWRIHNRRLREPLTGTEEWYEFNGRSVERPFWDGQGNLEEYEATLPDGASSEGSRCAYTIPGPGAGPSTGRTARAERSIRR